jgi:hypothetical protein
LFSLLSFSRPETNRSNETMGNHSSRLARCRRANSRDVRESLLGDVLTLDAFRWHGRSDSRQDGRMVSAEQTALSGQEGPNVGRIQPLPAAEGKPGVAGTHGTGTPQVPGKVLDFPRVVGSRLSGGRNRGSSVLRYLGYAYAFGYWGVAQIARAARDIENIRMGRYSGVATVGRRSTRAVAHGTSGTGRRSDYRTGPKKQGERM